jgi:hypothetical protein
MEKKKSLGTIVICAFLVAAFVAVVKAGVGAVCVTINGGDPFWVIFGLVIWGSSAGLIWLVGCMIWENEI